MPVGPVLPVAPVGPVRPVAPVEPVAPVAPVAPVGPVGPMREPEEGVYRAPDGVAPAASTVPEYVKVSVELSTTVKEHLPKLEGVSM